ncbi:hypothetical protein [Deinococcus maricopensis]|uniref:Uncharacterized protein n=1 Tax=Deinococcus maricopensis (strain DSM 21211 / LMG 22137 / NRRL B-23946 / LB-34) TaxID=709986 RepID=E8UC58_DEIML|nr:hypothetical protein [Deinococcus maricopensis]ADV68719.1 hypothetical protein Deima_3090 [Deinococcus maricopensis DSM 21211]
MQAWVLMGAVLSFAVGVVQLFMGDWGGALWTIGGVALGWYSRQLRR